MIKRPNEEKMKISEEFREGITADEQSTDTDGLISFKENHQGETSFNSKEMRLVETLMKHVLVR